MFILFVCVFSSASNRIIGAKDHASIQINIAEVKSGISSVCIVCYHTDQAQSVATEVQ